MDPRIYQVCALFGLLIFGLLFRDFAIGKGQMAVVFGAGFVVQGLGIWRLRLPKASILSALISCLSLLLLCRSNGLSLLALATVAALGSKFVLRYKGKHFFNPTNFGIVLLLLLSDRVWVSPAQWGTDLVFAYWMLFLGILVARRASRDDVSFTFLSCYLLLLLGRVIYLGQPYAVFFHQLQSGSLFLFTFFMISDPKSTPDHRVGRVVFACLVAVLAFVLRFYYFKTNALFYALFFLSPTTLILDNLWKSARFEWFGSGDKHVKQTSVSQYSNLGSRMGILRLLRRESRQHSL